MNIFVTSPSPIESAKFLDDKRVVKMVLETAQMLSTAITECGGTGFYKTTHRNHPCSVWARTSSTNYDWLRRHFKALCKEYALRYGKTHKCESYMQDIQEGLRYIPFGELTDFPNCTTYKKEEIHTAYQRYLNDKWDTDKRRPTWYGECYE